MTPSSALLIFLFSSLFTYYYLLIMQLVFIMYTYLLLLGIKNSKLLSEILKNMAIKTRLPWQLQCQCTRQDDLKMFPNYF